MKFSSSPWNRTRFLSRPLLGACLLLATGSGLMLAGCSGGAASKNGFYNSNSGLFVGADQPVGNGVARTFFELKNGIPLRQGLEFTPTALEGLPTTPPDTTSVAFVGPMPSTTNGSAFTNAFLAYLTSRSATNEPAQFHLSLLVRALTVTSEPYFIERADVAANEVPSGFTRSTSTSQPTGAVVSGGGVIYTNPASGLPAASLLGQSDLYYAGHLNGITLSPTLAQLQSKTTITQSINQPAVYPRDGYYPTKWTLTFDTTRNTHVLELTDFIRAPKFVPPGT